MVERVHLCRYFNNLECLWEWREGRRIEERVLITPKIAASMLEYNTHNVPLDVKKVVRYAGDIRSAKWREASRECLIFSNAEVLLNGQHRLWGILVANKALECIVIYGARKWEECLCKEFLDLG
jgi:hypothetical protein